MLKLKSSIKLIIALSFVIVLGLAFGTMKVEAWVDDDRVITSGTPTEQSLDNIPTTMNVDAQESELEKAGQIIYNKVKEELNKQGITIKDKIIDHNDVINGEINEKYTLRILLYRNNASVYITYNSDEGNTEIAHKDIEIKYNNSHLYNEEDELYVKNLLEKMGFTKDENDNYAINVISYKDIMNNPIQNESDKILKEIEEAGIVYEFATAMGGPDGGEVAYELFKEGIYYNMIVIKSKTCYYASIPSDMKEEEIIEYVQDKLKELLEEDFGSNYDTITLEKANGNYYNIFTNYGQLWGDMQILIERETKTAIEETDNSTGVKLETTNDVVPTDTKLVVEEITTGKEYTTVQNVLKEETTKMVVYDITLLSNNVEIQPNGNVKISLPIPSDYNKENLIVYRVEDNGTKTEYNVKVDGNYATFETDHFSTYVLAEKKVEDTNTDTEAPITNNDNKELDDTPKTGVETNGTAIALAITSILSLAGVVTLKRF